MNENPRLISPKTWIYALTLSMIALAQIITVAAIYLRTRPVEPPATAEAQPAPAPAKIPDKEEEPAPVVKPPSPALVITEVPPPPPDLSSEPDSPEAPEPAPAEPPIPEPPDEKALAQPLTDPQANRHLELARIATSEDDMATALKHLQAANALAAEHPNVLYEMAKVYDKIGSRQKATALFQKVANLGEQGAGQLARLATQHLHDGHALSSPNDPLHRPLSLGKISRQEERDPSKGERVTLTAAIAAQAGEDIDPNQILVHVFFYDLVDGKTIAQAEGERPQDKWLTEPADWKEVREELLQIHYQRAGEGGNRHYFGYIIKLYYRDEIQDVVAEPRMLVEKLANKDEATNDSLPSNDLFGK